MGRTIPSITQRMERILSDWHHMGRRMGKEDQLELDRLIAEIRNRRTAIDGADDPDLERMMMLAALIHLSGERNGRRSGNQNRLVGLGPADENR